MVTEDSKRPRMPMSPEELAFWERIAVECSPHCLDIRESPEGCSHYLADYARGLVLERRLLVKRERVRK